MSICDFNCKECRYEDCINDSLTKEDVERQNEFDFDANLKNHSSEKQKEHSKNYYWSHRDAIREKNKKYYHTHKEKFKEYDRIRRQTHPVSKEKRHEYYIKWRDKKRREKEQETKNEQVR